MKHNSLTALLLFVCGCAYGSTSHIRSVAVTQPVGLLTGTLDSDGLTATPLSHTVRRGVSLGASCAGEPLAGRIDFTAGWLDELRYDGVQGFGATHGAVRFRTFFFDHYLYDDLSIDGRPVKGVIDFDPLDGHYNFTLSHGELPLTGLIDFDSGNNHFILEDVTYGAYAIHGEIDHDEIDNHYTFNQFQFGDMPVDGKIDYDFVNGHYGLFLSTDGAVAQETQRAFCSWFAIILPILLDYQRALDKEQEAKLAKKITSFIK